MGAGYIQNDIPGIFFITTEAIACNRNTLLYRGGRYANRLIKVIGTRHL